MVADCRSLARFKVANIPPMPAGMGRVEVRFSVDADGILSVNATEQTTQTMSSVTVKPSHGLTDEEIENMLLDSVEHGEDDMQKRLLAEAQVDARRMLLDAHKQLREYGHLLSEPERTALVDEVTTLEKLAMAASSHSDLREALTKLDAAAQPFVERIMNHSIAKAAVGHTVEEF
jgi:molecular chaperone HscA